MARVYTIKFPPGTELISANARDHWSKRATVTSHLRKQAFELARDQDLPSLGKVRIRAIYHPPDRRKRDSSNILFLSAKAAIDGIVDAAWMADDNDRIVRSLELLPSSEVVKGGQMVIEIEEDDGDDGN